MLRGIRRSPSRHWIWCISRTILWESTQQTVNRMQNNDRGKEYHGTPIPKSQGGAGIPVVSPAYARKLLESVKSNVVAASAVIMCAVSTPLPPNHRHLQQLQPPHPPSLPLSSPFLWSSCVYRTPYCQFDPAAVRGFVNVRSAVSPQFR